MLFTDFLIGLGSGVNSIVAHCIGTGDEAQVKRASNAAAIVSLVSGAVVGVSGAVLAEPLLRILGTKPELLDGAVLYMRIYFAGMPALAFYNYGRGVFSADGDTVKPLLFLLAAGVINVALNLFFVIVCKLSVAGVAFASVISQYISAVLVFGALVKTKRSYGINFKDFRVEAEKVKHVISLGLPAGVQCAVFQTANLFIQAGVNTFDTVMVEGNAAAANADALVYDMMSAVYTACTSFMAQNFGAGKRKRVIKSYFICLAYSFAIGFVVGVGLVFSGRFFLSFFTSDPAVVEAGMKRLTIMGFSYCVCVFMDCTIAASRSLGKTIIPTVIVIMGSCVFRIIWVYTIFNYFKTIPSLYLLYVFSWIITAAAEIIYFVMLCRRFLPACVPKTDGAKNRRLRRIKQRRKKSGEVKYMSKFTQMLEGIESSNDFDANACALQYICNMLEGGGAKSLTKADAAELKRFAISEMRRLIAAIPEAENYKSKYSMFCCENWTVGIFTLANGGTDNVTEEEVDVINQLITLVRCEQVLENAIDDMFKLEKIDRADVEEVLKIVKPIKDLFRRSLLYSGLHEYAEDMKKFTPEAKSALAGFVAAEFKAMLKKDSLSEDELTSLEYASDVCKYFADGEIYDLLEEILKIKNQTVRFYALQTLLSAKRDVPASVIREMAEDLSYAELTYCELAKHGKLSLYPDEYSSDEYLAKSEMVHWLVYPTELNKQPDEIELVGKVAKKKTEYYIFKYKSDSDNLGDELKGKWLIGWSSRDGGTFSNFDLLSDFEKKTVEKTLKNIAKKLL